MREQGGDPLSYQWGGVTPIERQRRWSGTKWNEKKKKKNKKNEFNEFQKKRKKEKKKKRKEKERMKGIHE